MRRGWSYPTTRGLRRLQPRRLVFAVTIVALTAGIVPGAGAQSGQGTPPPTKARFAVQPSSPKGPVGRDWFIYTLSPGQVFGDVVGISNFSDKPIKFLIYAKDAHSIPNVGGFGVQQDAEAPIDVGSWIKLKTNTYTVKPGKRVDIPFSITIPDNATPGDHAGAILAADMAGAQTVTDAQGLSFNVRERVGARIYVRVRGPLAPAMRVDRLAVTYDQAAVPLVAGGAAATVSWKVRNTGNVRLTPTVQLRVKWILGWTVKTLPPKKIPELLPGGTYESQDIVKGLPTFGPLKVELTVTAEDVKVVRAKSFWALHWLVLVAIGLVLAAAGRWLYLRWRRRSPQKPLAVKPPVAAPPRERRTVRA